MSYSAYEHFNSEVGDKIKALAAKAEKSTVIAPEFYKKYDVKRGLRDEKGVGVLAGLTEISEIHGYSTDYDGNKIPCKGELYYRGIEIKQLVNGITSEGRFGFEEVAYLLLFGTLPDKDELKCFKRILRGYRSLPDSFVRDVIMKAPSGDIMNAVARSILMLYSYDKHADDTSVANVLRQCLQLIAEMPMLSVYSYKAHRHFHCNDSLVIHKPLAKCGTAENILHLLRDNGEYTELEARVLDACLTLQAEHGGGNNSSFTMHVVSSTGTDTYSAMAAALGSLKGPRHGGANIKVVNMIEDILKNVPVADDKHVEEYLNKILDKQAFDGAGLIYGMGHAVYSLSDPRADILKGFVKQLAEAEGYEREFEMYSAVERLAPKVIGERRNIQKGVSANVDFYTGFIYSMLGLPKELFTPIFAVARIVGWSAHRIEEISNKGKIIRPAYESVCDKDVYKPLEKR
ncbi:MAG: citrate/2-methylcitrate synthase [Christensenellaceae bacterium]|nr:citrate/2-methylcitrate synthase [Christensenellaceae bacterium]MDD6361383.1 citrate/2-methylcitrate synthase [Christensenellaceae bacterium]